ncbi:MAG: hypothetical protein Q8P12_04250 [bacterium]|nr:hypothetical protein [bacterium]
MRFRGFEALQLYVVSAAVFAYIGWGALFHYYHRRLNWGMVLEYFLIGALVLLLFFWLLLFS